MPDFEMERRSEVHSHDHAVFVYDDRTDLLMPFEAFLQEGRRARQATTFVHSFEDAEEPRRFLGQKIAELPTLEAERDLALAHHRDAFERNGVIDHAHVEGIVGMLGESARATGKEGVRIFVDASRKYFDAGRTDEWFAFESWLGPRLQADVGLVCAYRARDLEDPDILARVLRTHGYRFHAPGTSTR